MGRAMIETDVAIVGAGGGGAVLALMLAQQGVRSLLLERAAGPPQGLRGEILQPNGQRVLDRLGLLNKLPPQATKSIRRFNFCRAGGERLCTVDYGELPAPYNRAVVTLPNVAHRAILDALERQNPDGLWYESTFTGLRFDGSRVTGLQAERRGEPVDVSARLVVGADGAFSKVRDCLGIATQVHRYSEGYLIAMLDAPQELEEARYLVGKGTILGIFPAAGQKVYLFFMIAAGSYEAVKARGIEALRQAWVRIDPGVEAIVQGLADWSQTGYMPTGRVKTDRWVTDGALLIGDAAHAMNPHASQGRMQAMVDALVVADLIPGWLKNNDLSAQALRAYEVVRRPQVTMLQRLADEQVIFWNTGNPLLALLRDRVFRTLDRNARLRYRVLSTTAGLRSQPPFSLLDRVMAAGFLPDPRAHLTGC
ncbi:MAG: putative 2-octaprenyl-3-methyl-6-methoxy,4-benzoquinol hydroxylase [Nitrospira sp.]|nr:putative 2-octaprenyl-3-methyl-6-methoxy,4-benzoquinol hydroxylase [Nitrospira sp.]